MIAAFGCGLYDSLEAVTKAFVHYKEATFLPTEKCSTEQIYQIGRSL
ncbi:hypothetical protein QK908_11795 [Lactococcus cremoris]